MQTTSHTALRQQLQDLNADQPTYASQFVRLIIEAAQQTRVSDIHLQPTAKGLQVRWRMDGVLQTVGSFPPGKSSDIVSRLKVLAELLTYQNDVPQEGRIRSGYDGDPIADPKSAHLGTAVISAVDLNNPDTNRSHVEMRVSTFPTLYGERAVIRFFGSAGQLHQLDDLGWPTEMVTQIRRVLGKTSGALLLTGAAGSGKTTAAYACLREIVATHDNARNVVSLEDPIEVAVAGVAQSQVNPAAGFNLHSGLKSILRQDPEVLFVGEIRDNTTAEVAFQAALTGQLLITTFHAGSAAEAVSRLLDMGIDSYSLRSGLLAILSQRLVRKLCRLCSREAASPDEWLGLATTQARLPVGCDACRGTGYWGRMVLAELLVVQRHEISKAILARASAAHIEQLAIEAGMVPIAAQALRAVQAGNTSPAEVRRVLGCE